MRRTQRTTILSIGAAIFLWAGLAIGEQGYGHTWGRVGSSSGRAWVQFRGRVLSAESAAKAPRAAPASRVYQLNHRLGHVVIEIPTDAAALPYHRLWLNGEDQLFETLAAEENRFKEVEITGQLREYRPTVGIVDLPTLRVLG